MARKWEMASRAAECTQTVLGMLEAEPELKDKDASATANTSQSQDQQADEAAAA